MTYKTVLFTFGRTMTEHVLDKALDFFSDVDCTGGEETYVCYGNGSPVLIKGVKAGVPRAVEPFNVYMPQGNSFLGIGHVGSSIYDPGEIMMPDSAEATERVRKYLSHAHGIDINAAGRPDRALKPSIEIAFLDRGISTRSGRVNTDLPREYLERTDTGIPSVLRYELLKDPAFSGDNWTPVPEGVEGRDMETAYFFEAARLHKKPSAAVLVVSDNEKKGFPFVILNPEIPEKRALKIYPQVREADDVAIRTVFEAITS